MKRIIGSVLYQGATALAQLDEEGSWSVVREGKSDPTAAESLQIYYRREFGPADGDPLILQLEDFARRSGGTLNITAKPGRLHPFVN
jgi:hypothetical protein